jgi:DNA-binding XRE family transcriptional regulator
MMSGPEARALRQQTGLDYKAWAALLEMKPQSIINVENGHALAGKMLERVWRRLAQQKKKKIPKIDTNIT